MSEFTKCEDCIHYEEIGTDFCYWCEHRISEDNFKPKEKNIIDLGKMVGSDIDMEFADNNAWFIDYLIEIINTDINNSYPYVTKKRKSIAKCRIRENHWHFWQGGECPLPEGLEIEIMYRCGEAEESLILYHRRIWSNNWLHNSEKYDIIAFKVLGTADGWSYEYETE